MGLNIGEVLATEDADDIPGRRNVKPAIKV
jgi:hypothetical protein